jgi:hypothetical protein
MRIVIEVDGEKVTAIGSDSPSGTPANVDAPPGSPPAALLERAKKLGAMNAGPATFGVGAALAATANAGEALEPPRQTRARKPAKKP